MRLKVGNVVKVSSDSAIHAGKIGTLIPKSLIPMKENGVPDIVGCTNLLQPKEVGIRLKDNSIIICYLNKLEKISDD